MKAMTPDEIRRFLLDTPRTGHLAVVRKDGHPHVAPIWFDLDGEVLVFTTWHTSIKGRSLRRDPRICMAVDDPAPPYAYVIFNGLAQIMSPTPEEFLYWTTRIAGRYLGADRADAFGRRNAVPGELLIRATPTKIVAHKGIAD